MSHSHSIAFISHGGGPMPLLGDPGHAEMIKALQKLTTLLPTPKAVVVISAHWETETTTLTAGEQPPLIYDYYGFPPAAYEVQYPAPGAPALAEELATCLQQADIPVQLDRTRGFDHGLFVPLKIMYPSADIPCVQVSLNNSLDPGFHLRLGQAMASLSSEGVLFLGSGFSFHNMRAFFSLDNPDQQALNNAFEHWLQETLNSDIDEADREQRLRQWEQAPGARFCHPREEHLLPLHVCYGLAGKACADSMHFKVIGKQASAYRW